MKNVDSWTTLPLPLTDWRTVATRHMALITGSSTAVSWEHPRTVAMDIARTCCWRRRSWCGADRLPRRGVTIGGGREGSCPVRAQLARGRKTTSPKHFTTNKQKVSLIKLSCCNKLCYFGCHLVQALVTPLRSTLLSGSVRPQKFGAHLIASAPRTRYC